MPDRIDLDGSGALDDVVFNLPTMFRIERMNETCFWTRAYREDQPDIVINFFARLDEKGQPYIDTEWHEDGQPCTPCDVGRDADLTKFGLPPLK